VAAFHALSVRQACVEDSVGDRFGKSGVFWMKHLIPEWPIRDAGGVCESSGNRQPNVDPFFKKTIPLSEDYTFNAENVGD
jgi:hypothetical protein